MHTVTPAALNRAKLLVEPALRAAVDSLDENLRLPVTYHLGWTDQDGNPSDAGAAKGCDRLWRCSEQKQCTGCQMPQFPAE